MYIVPKYIVWHDYGMEGWRQVGSYATLREAVLAREDDIRNGGGVSIITASLPVLEAYGLAAYEVTNESE